MAEVGVLDGAAADDASLLAALREVVNEAYDRGEVGLWAEGSERISTGGLRELVAAGELVAALDDGEVVGCVRVTSIDRGLAELGLLAVRRERAGSGLGGALIGFAHDLARARGHATMRLTLLVPREGTHPFKERLHGWYGRQGYRVVGREDFSATHPEVASELLVACDLLVFERPLG